MKVDVIEMLFSKIAPQGDLEEYFANHPNVTEATKYKVALALCYDLQGRENFPNPGARLDVVQNLVCSLSEHVGAGNLDILASTVDAFQEVPWLQKSELRSAL